MKLLSGASASHGAPLRHSAAREPAPPPDPHPEPALHRSTRRSGSPCQLPVVSPKGGQPSNSRARLGGSAQLSVANPQFIRDDKASCTAQGDGLLILVAEHHVHGFAGMANCDLFD